LTYASLRNWASTRIRSAAAIALFDSGATVPFVAHYRKEATGALDDTQLRRLEEQLRYLRDLDERRAVGWSDPRRSWQRPPTSLVTT